MLCVLCACVRVVCVTVSNVPCQTLPIGLLGVDTTTERRIKKDRQKGFPDLYQ